MKIQKLAMLSAATIALTAACQKSPNPENEIKSVVSFSSTISNQIVTKVVGNKWENNDAIGVFMKTGAGLTNPLASNKNYITATGNGNFTAKSSTDEILYPADGSKVDFIAYYPYQATLTNNTFAVNLADQSQPSKIDILYSNNLTGANKSNPNAQLNFNHSLSKVELTVIAGTGVSSLSGLSATIDGLNTTAQFDVATGALSGQSNKTAFQAKTTAGTSGTLAEAIVLPTTSATGSTVVFKIGADSYTWTVPTTTVYEAGKKYTYNILLQTSGNNNIAVVISSSIIDWTDLPSGNYTLIKDNNGGVNPNPIETKLYEEDFGTMTFTRNPKIASYTGWSNTKVIYADETGNADIRKTSSTTNHLWLPANREAELSISGINTDKATSLKFSFDVAANVFNDGTSFDVKNITIDFNGQKFSPASKVLSKENNDTNVFYPIEINLSGLTSIPAVSKIKISTITSENTVGIRVDNLLLKGAK